MSRPGSARSRQAAAYRRAVTTKMRRSGRISSASRGSNHPRLAGRAIPRLRGGEECVLDCLCTSACWRGRRLRGRRGGAIATLAHELIEFRLVFGKAQPFQEFGKFLLLFLEPAQRLRAIFIEGMITAR